jgi:hypothetical protein
MPMARCRETASRQPSSVVTDGRGRREPVKRGQPVSAAFLSNPNSQSVSAFMEALQPLSHAISSA